MKFLILTGEGINCEGESDFVLRQAGAQTKILHVRDLLERPKYLEDFQGLVFPGGFSFGDELGSGQVLALELRHRLQDALQEFLQKPRAVLGICNGFQVLTKLGVLPFKKTDEQSIALARNDHGKFLDQWVELEVNTKSHCHWLQGIEETLSMPMRHGEGRLLLPQNASSEMKKQVQEELWCFRYKKDVNGSFDRIAGITDPSGWVLGIMPHPEAASFRVQSSKQERLTPAQVMEPLPSFALFKSILKALKQT